jgi:hypothetical protein
MEFRNMTLTAKAKCGAEQSPRYFADFGASEFDKDDDIP